MSFQQRSYLSFNNYSQTKFSFTNPHNLSQVTPLCLSFSLLEFQLKKASTPVEAAPAEAVAVEAIKMNHRVKLRSPLTSGIAFNI